MSELLLSTSGLVAGRDRDLCGPFDLAVEGTAGLLIMGSNGCGKSTLLRTLAGLLRPRAGSVQRRDKLRVSWLGQFHPRPEALPLTVRECLALERRHQSKAELVAALHRFGVAHLASRTLGALSGGERSRVALAASFLGGPDLLFLDEPFAELDPEARAEAWQELEEFRRSGGSFLMVTHHAAPEFAADIEVLKL